MKTMMKLVTIFVMAAAMAAAAPSHAYLQVKGLACPFCVQGLEKHLKRIPGVTGVKTALEKGEVVVHIDDPQEVTEERLRAAVKSAGFTAGSVRIEADGTEQPDEGERGGGRK